MNGPSRSGAARTSDLEAAEATFAARLARPLVDLLAAAGQALRAATSDSAAILAAVPSAIITTDTDGRIESLSDAAERLFGYSRTQMLGKAVSLLVAPAERDLFRGGLRACLHGDDAEAFRLGRTFSARRRDGSVFSAHLAVAEVDAGGRVLFTAVVTDLSDANRVDRLKREFVSTVSHELRTPLTSIKGSLGLLRAHTMGRLPDTALPLVDIAYNNSDRLVRIINDLLDMEKIESGKMSFDVQTTELRPLLERALEANKGFANQTNVTLAFDGAPARLFIACDADRIVQVLSNLLSTR